MRAGRFSGGITLPGLKPPAGPVRTLPLPAVLRVPLLQHAGAACEPCVAVGDAVARFAVLGRPPADALGAPVHAPAAGRVLAIEPGPTALPGTPIALHVLIEVDADGPEQRLPRLDPATATAPELLSRIAEAGVVGLGGAGFPSAEKLAAGRRWLVLNAAECEPVVACDDSLVADEPDDVLDAAAMLARLVGAERVTLALEDRMGRAIDAMTRALAARAAAGAPAAGVPPVLEVAVLESRYPSGGERQLIEALAGVEVPYEGLPRDVGIVVHNVATAVAALRAVRDGEPLVRRRVTVGGDGAAAAATFDVALGTPARALAEAVGGWLPAARVLRAGGPMMGVPLPDDDVSVGKTTIALTAWCAAALAPMPCIRCGDCASACPSRLLPQQLHARLQAKDIDGALALGLMACIECGACDAVCPSAIPLTQGFAAARHDERARRAQHVQADEARGRFERRGERLARLADDAAKRQARRAAKTVGAAAAALARARAKRSGTSDPPPADGDGAP